MDGPVHLPHLKIIIRTTKYFDGTETSYGLIQALDCSFRRAEKTQATFSSLYIYPESVMVALTVSTYS